MAKIQKKFSHEDENHRYPSHPGVGVSVVVWRGNQVLLIQRKNPPHAGAWSLPGGKQKLGETILEAAAREVREETGLSIAPLGIITAIDAITRDSNRKIEYHYTIVEVAAEALEGTACAGDDAQNVCWVSLEEIEKLCVSSEIHRIVQMSALERALS